MSVPVECPACGGWYKSINNHLCPTPELVTEPAKSDTPRTDAEPRMYGLWVSEDFARILERELVAAQSKLAEAEAKLAQIQLTK